MGRTKGAWALALAGLGLAACASTPRPLPPGPPPPHASRRPPSPPPTPRPASTESPVAFAALAGWDGEDHVAAFRAYQAGCPAARGPGAGRVCRQARAMGPVTDSQAKAFFETNFQPMVVGGDGLLTAYFQPEYEARNAPEGEFTGAVRAPPPETQTATRAPAQDELAQLIQDPLDAQLKSLLTETQPVADPYSTREIIELTPMGEKALAYMRPEDLFFMQIQGSGLLDFPDGRRMRAVFAATNGKPFVGLARIMREQHILADKDTSQEAIHAWLAAHRGRQADELMWKNPRYVFFRLLPDDGQQPAGAAGIPLPPGRALAVDTNQHALGGLYWIDASAPVLNGAFPSYRRLAMALDVGGAIRGPVRADLYIGRGEAAGREAGRVRHSLRLYELVPRP